MMNPMGRWYPDYPGQQMFQDPAYMRMVGQPVHPQNVAPANQQDMIPTIRTEIKQIPSVDDISKSPPAPGTTGAYMTKDEKLIIFRTMYANGEFTDKIYDERPPAPPAPKINPADYVRKDELEEILSRFQKDKEGE